MTEDDTFNALRRPGVRDMLLLWLESPIVSWHSDGTEGFFESHGWKKEEFGDAWQEYNNGSVRDV